MGGIDGSVFAAAELVLAAGATGTGIVSADFARSGGRDRPAADLSELTQGKNGLRDCCCILVEKDLGVVAKLEGFLILELEEADERSYEILTPLAAGERAPGLGGERHRLPEAADPTSYSIARRLAVVGQEHRAIVAGVAGFKPLQASVDLLDEGIVVAHH